MPVSVTAAASAIARPRSATRRDGLVGGDHSGQRGGGELADAVAGDQIGGDAELLEGGQRGGHQKRLGDGRVADLLGVGGGAVGDEVELRDLRPC